eukprot:TRINITY_DN5236_c9_g1_i1.p1 TRINITY_DN5236_c9_g1~~TRINITY_DN5236_c9_g1_i1.p1  ORF type:complete len:280 (+),score=35.65 TRINITY_DN5236_c9_g1_i1:59-898(+)
MYPSCTRRGVLVGDEVRELTDCALEGKFAIPVVEMEGAHLIATAIESAARVGSPIGIQIAGDDDGKTATQIRKLADEHRACVLLFSTTTTEKEFEDVLRVDEDNWRYKGRPLYSGHSIDYSILDPVMVARQTSLLNTTLDLVGSDSVSDVLNIAKRVSDVTHQFTVNVNDKNTIQSLRESAPFKITSSAITETHKEARNVINCGVVSMNVPMNPTISKINKFYSSGKGLVGLTSPPTWNTFNNKAPAWVELARSSVVKTIQSNIYKYESAHRVAETSRL